MQWLNRRRQDGKAVAKDRGAKQQCEPSETKHGSHDNQENSVQRKWDQLRVLNAVE